MYLALTIKLVMKELTTSAAKSKNVKKQTFILRKKEEYVLNAQTIKKDQLLTLQNVNYLFVTIINI